MNNAAETFAATDCGNPAAVLIPLKRLDPRARLLTALLLVTDLLLLPPGIELWITLGFAGLFLYAGRPPLKRLAFALAAVGWMLALTLLLHAFSTPGRILWTMPGINWTLTAEGIQGGGLLAGRLAALALLGVTLSLSLSALESIRAVDALLAPLVRLKIPAGSFSLMLGLTLRFVPILYSETLQLRKALRARGWEPGKGVLDRVRAWIPLFIPLLANALRRADDLAETLVLRGYDPRSTRTRYGLSRWGRLDTAAVAVTSTPLLAWLAGLIL